MTRRETFTNLSDVWAKEVDLYSTNQDCIKMLVGNKVDRVSSAFFTSVLEIFLFSLLPPCVVALQADVTFLTKKCAPAPAPHLENV